MLLNACSIEFKLFTVFFVVYFRFKANSDSSDVWRSVPVHAQDEEAAAPARAAGRLPGRAETRRLGSGSGVTVRVRQSQVLRYSSKFFNDRLDSWM